MAGRNGDSGGPRFLAPYADLYKLAGGHLLTKEQVRSSAEAITVAVNDLLDTASGAHEHVANLVFAASFGHDVKGALDPARKPPPVYLALKKRAGASLGIDADELSEHLRIGALNAGDHGDAWNHLPWTKKRALLPLVKLNSAAVFAHGVDFANGPNVGVRHVIKWVQAEVKKAHGTPEPSEPQAPEFTLKSGKKLVETAVPLSSAKARKAFAKKMNALPAPERKKFRKDLEAAGRNMLRLAAEIHEGPDET